ncbi:cytochrome-c peroxidase [Aureivirga sp. CE67]|uniref:cytochrome-c peroxidase n=1 Tax=Aureivirga sp. CE67 TaxID=1788983 RepID=UPI0018C91C6C|nr:cytochrome c peroxidase [Aureivirga sp. CE67]
MRIFTILGITLLLFSCSKDDEGSRNDSNGNKYNLEYTGLPKPNIAEDNKLTKNGVELGRRLFYEKTLSEDNSMSCASCHVQKDAFSDIRRFSEGVKGLPGKRQAMAVFNMAWNDNKFFWDGRANLLRDQSLLPIQDHLEMNETLDNVILKLKANADYVERFQDVFEDGEINSFNISLALEQFMNSIVSNNSKYDKFLQNKANLSASEERGRVLYFRAYDPLKPNQAFGNCIDCHGGANFENDSYMNNGLDTDEEMTDLGRGAVTERAVDRGTFKIPSLRNIELTPPYMHDGRFETLEEVIDHYNSGVKLSTTLNPTMLSLANEGSKMNEQDKKDLIAFLKTLTDYDLVTNPKYSDPFE